MLTLTREPAWLARAQRGNLPASALGLAVAGIMVAGCNQETANVGRHNAALESIALLDAGVNAQTLASPGTLPVRSMLTTQETLAPSLTFSSDSGALTTNGLQAADAQLEDLTMSFVPVLPENLFDEFANMSEQGGNLGQLATVDPDWREYIGDSFSTEGIGDEEGDGGSLTYTIADGDGEEDHTYYIDDGPIPCPTEPALWNCAIVAKAPTYEPNKASAQDGPVVASQSVQNKGLRLYFGSSIAGQEVHSGWERVTRVKTTGHRSRILGRGPFVKHASTIDDKLSVREDIQRTFDRYLRDNLRVHGPAREVENSTEDRPSGVSREGGTLLSDSGKVRGELALAFGCFLTRPYQDGTGIQHQSGEACLPPQTGANACAGNILSRADWQANVQAFVRSNADSGPPPGMAYASETLWGGAYLSSATPRKVGNNAVYDDQLFADDGRVAITGYFADQITYGSEVNLEAGAKFEGKLTPTVTLVFNGKSYKNSVFTPTNQIPRHTTFGETGQKGAPFLTTGGAHLDFRWATNHRIPEWSSTEHSTTIQYATLGVKAAVSCGERTWSGGSAFIVYALDFTPDSAMKSMNDWMGGAVRLAVPNSYVAPTMRSAGSMTVSAP